jgi:hypothetical protein
MIKRRWRFTPAEPSKVHNRLQAVGRIPERSLKILWMLAEMMQLLDALSKEVISVSLSVWFILD